MAVGRPAVPTKLKALLVKEAGDKCANPGCPNRLIELHHIIEWHVCHTHDAEHMIAICPSCHDAVDRGALRITDEDLYRWKGIDRRSALPSGHIYIEPSESPKLLLGSFAVTGDSSVVVFELSGQNRLAFALREREVLLLSAHLSGIGGESMLDVVDGYVRTRVAGLGLNSRPGIVEVPLTDPGLLPEWLLRQIRIKSTGPEFPWLKVEVLRPGLARVQGIWIAGEEAVVITDDAFCVMSAQGPAPITFRGGGESTLFKSGLSSALFDVPSWVSGANARMLQ